MKKIIILLIFELFLGCSRDKKVNFIYSPDKNFCLSQFNYQDEKGQNFTIFTYGKTQSNQLPDSYIKVRNQWNEAWYGLIQWNGAAATLFYTYHDFEAVNLEKSLLQMNEMESEQVFASYFFDKVPNNYIKVSTQ